MSPARTAALEALTTAAARFPDLLPVEPDDTDLAPRDAALAHALADAVVRRWLTLDHLLARFTPQPPGELIPPLHAALLAGAAQMLLLDRVPVHAAIHDTVEWTKHAVSRGASGMANAVLRNLDRLIAGPRETYTDQTDEIPLSGGRAIAFKEAVLPADAAQRLSIATSVPRALIDAWGAFGTRTCEQIAMHTIERPPTCLTTRYAETPDDSVLTPHDVEGSAVFIGTHLELINLLAQNDDLWVQDPASAASLSLAKDLKPKFVIDVCAGRGTKTRQLLAMYPEAKVVAAETDSARLAELERVFANHPRVRVLPAQTLADLMPGRADLVLLDVPCSNTGVLGRRPEARYRAPGSAQRRRLVALQREIAETAAALLTPHAAILYATCSLEREENQEQATWLSETLDMHIAAEHLTLPAGEPGSPPTARHDGAYAALLTR